jgi:uncharacterized protein
MMVSIPKLSNSRWLFDKIRFGEIDFGLTTDILEEYEEVIGTYYSPNLASNVCEMLVNKSNALLISPYYFWNLIETDLDDNKYVDCAIACNADFIITHDGHFKVLDKISFPKVQRITIAAFKEYLISINRF